MRILVLNAGSSSLKFNLFDASPESERVIEKGEVVDPASYYFRINPLFESEATKYDWINRVIAVGIGHRFADGPVYSVFEVL